MVQSDFIQALALIDSRCKALTDLKLLKSTMKKRSFRIAPFLLSKLKMHLEKEVLNEFNQRFIKIIPQEDLFSSLEISCFDDNDCKQKVFKTSGYFTFRSSMIKVIEGYLDLCTYEKSAFYDSYFNDENYLIGIRNHCCRFDEEQDKLNNDNYAEIEEEEIDGPVEFIRKNTAMVSVKHTFVSISNFLSLDESD